MGGYNDYVIIMLKWVHHTPSLPKNHTTVITRDSLKSNEEEEEEEEKILNNVPDKIEYDNTDNEDECKDLEKDEHIMIDISLKRRLGVRIIHEYNCLFTDFSWFM